MRKFYIENNEAIPAIAFEVSKPTGFTEVTDPIKLQELHNARYAENAKSGLEYCRKFTTEMYLFILDGTYTPIEVVVLEDYLSSVYTKIEGGHWLSAQGILPQMPLSGIFTQVMKDKVQSDIDTYVTENY